MKIGIQQSSWYHYDLLVKRFFFRQKIGTATISLDGKRIDMHIDPKWLIYARNFGEILKKEYNLQYQHNEQGS